MRGREHTGWDHRARAASATAVAIDTTAFAAKAREEGRAGARRDRSKKEAGAPRECGGDVAAGHCAHARIAALPLCSTILMLSSSLPFRMLTSAAGSAENATAFFFFFCDASGAGAAAKGAVALGVGCC